MGFGNRRGGEWGTIVGTSDRLSGDLFGMGVWVHREERERWVYKKLVGMEGECGKG